MSLFIQSANSLVTRVAQWVGAIPVNVTNSGSNITATAYNPTSGVITTSANATSQVFVGDFISPTSVGPFTAVLSVTSSQITVSDPDLIWSAFTTPAILKLPTQSTLDIQFCIQFAELSFRTIYLPALRSNPYDPVNPSTIVTDINGLAPIPADMNWPIIFFQQTPSTEVPPGTLNAGFGPWIIYDRVGDREIIRLSMIDQLYVKPFGVPRVIRAQFSEVGPNYLFTPNPGNGTTIKAYYVKSFPFLLGPTGDSLTPLVQNNAILATFPEGYMYKVLAVYYDKKKNTTEAEKWNGRFDAAYGLIEDQAMKDLWSGGDRHLTSEFQPRNYRYSFR
jgi:hypothetical protein